MAYLKKSLPLLLLIGGGLAVGIMLLELGARLFLPPAAQPEQFRDLGQSFTCSSALGWRGKPNFNDRLSHPEFERQLILNSRGMHDTDHPVEKAANTSRVLLLGDSFTEAIQVDETETAHQQLEHLLNERLGEQEHRFEVISGAVSGWGTGQQLRYYQQEGQHYQPDLVLLMLFLGNDFQDNLPGHAITIEGFNCFAPYFPVCDGELSSEPWPYIPGLAPAWAACSPLGHTISGWLNIIRNHSDLFARLEPLLLQQTKIRRFGESFDLPYTALYLPRQQDEVLAYSWQVTEALILRLRQEVEADGAEFGVVFFGPREVIWLSLFDEQQARQLYETNPHLRDAQADYPNQQLAAFFQKHDIAALDLQPGLRDYIAQTGADLYFPLDRHWTAEGNRIVAEMIFGWLTANDRLPLVDSSP